MAYRVFLSSPSDVADERLAAKQVIEKINSEYGDDAPFDVIDWQDQYYSARETFQSQIEKPSRCDIVLCILWSRSGTELPLEFARPDGSIPTGTEFEIEDALDAALISPEQTPDILLYRKTAPVVFSEENLEVQVAQRQRVVSYFDNWTRSETGNFTAAFTDFENLSTFQILIARHLRNWLEERNHDVVWTTGSPFPGLGTFEERHHPVFFGRRRMVGRARARLLANAALGSQFLLISGASGSGKSSLVRAGLVPRLRLEGGLGENIAPVLRHTFRISDLEDGGQAIGWQTRFAEQLLSCPDLAPLLKAGDFDDASKLASQLNGSNAAIPIEGALKRGARKKHDSVLILVVDQLEELFSWPDDERDALGAMLRGLCSSPNLRVIATIRSDFQHRLGEIPALVQLLDQDRIRDAQSTQPVFTLPVANIGELSEMIRGPARAAGLTYEVSPDGEQLSDVIEREANGEALPALQFLLAQLYENRSQQALTFKTFQDLGGIAGSMASRGEEALTAFAENGISTDATFSTLMRQLVRVPETGDPPVATTVAEGIFVDAGEQAMLDVLRDSGLLASNERQVRIAHESLLTRWPRLSNLIASERGMYETRARVVRAAERYGTNPNSAPLLRDFDLQEARQLLNRWGKNVFGEQADIVASYIAKSRGKARARTIALTSFAATMVALMLVGGFFYLQSQQSIEKAEFAQNIANAIREMSEGDYNSAAINSAVALKSGDNYLSRSTLVNALAKRPAQPVVSGETDQPVRVTAEAGRVSLIERQGQALVVHTSEGRKSFRFDGSQINVPHDAPQTAQWIDPETVFAFGRNGRLIRYKVKGEVLTADWAEPALSPTDLFDGNELVWGRGTDSISVLAKNSTFTRTFALKCRTARTPVCSRTIIPQGATGTSLSPNGKAVAWIDLGFKEDASEDDASWIEGPPRLIVQSLDDADSQTIQKLEMQTANEIVWRRDSNTLSVLDTSNYEVSVFDIAPRGIKPREPQTRIEHALVNAVRGNEYLEAMWAKDFVVITVDGAIYRRIDEKTLSVVTLGKGIQLRPEVSPDGEAVVAVIDEEVGVWAFPKSTEPILFGYIPGAVVDQVAYERAIKSGAVFSASLSGAIYRNGPAGPSIIGNIQSDVNDTIQAVFAAPNQGNDFIAALTSNGIRLVASDGEVIAGCGENPSVSGSWLDERSFISDGPGETVLICTLKGKKVTSRLVSLTLDPEIERGISVDGVGKAPGGFVASMSDGSLRRHQLESGVTSLLVSSDAVGDGAGSALTLKVDGTGRFLVATRNDNRIKLYDLSNGAITQDILLSTLKPERANTVAADFSPDNRHLLMVSADGTSHVFAFKELEGTLSPLFEIAAPEIPEGKVVARPFWYDSKHLAYSNHREPPRLIPLDQASWLSHVKAFKKN